MKKLSLFMLLAIGLSLSQCKKEDPHVWNDPGIPGGNPAPTYSINKGGTILMDAFGIIEDEQGNPLQGVNVTLGSKVYTSNQHGQVKISQGSAFENIAYLKAEMPGYFTGSRSFVPTSGVNHFIIRMMSKGSPQVFQAGTGATLKQGNAEVVVGDAYVDASGKAYTGEVKAYVRHLDPEDDNLLAIMPGALRGADANGEKVLETYGMIAVELEGSAGQKLQLAKDHPSTIKAKVPSSLTASAPATIPLWHFDETNGIWSHDGEAKLENGSYVGKVSHFSTWNYDLPNSVARIYGKVSGEDGTSINGVYIDYRLKGGSHSGGYPDADGNFVAQLPFNTDLTLLIKFENTVIYSETFNTGNNAQITKEYKIPSLNLSVVSGTVYGCNGSLVPNGSIVTDRWTTSPIVNGKFKFMVMMEPGKSIELTAIYLYGGNSQTRTVAIDQKNIIVPDFGLCTTGGSADDFEFSFTVDGQNYQIEGIKSVNQSDSLLSFIGGKACLDFSTDHDFQFWLNKYGDWNKQSQFKMPGSGNGYFQIDLGNGFMHAKDVDINVISKSPYNIEFSGTYTYYDKATQQYKDGLMTNGKIIEK